MALVIRCSGSAFPVITDDGGNAQRGKIMRCHADKRKLQHVDGERRLIVKANQRKEKRDSRMPPVVHERNHDRHYETAGYDCEGQELSGWDRSSSLIEPSTEWLRKTDPAFER